MKPAAGALTAVILGFFASCAPLGSGKEAPRVRITFFDVGQGDAALIEPPSGARFLVDAGPDSSGIDTLLDNRNIGRLNGLVITHAHADHYGGVRMVLRQCRADRVWIAPLCENIVSPEFRQLLEWITDTVKIDTASGIAGKALFRDGDKGAFFLSPAGPDTSGTQEGINGTSCVLLFSFGKSRALFAGDIGFETEKQLLQKGALGPVLILKAGHHGSATSTSTAFLSALMPEAAVISVGAANDYGHPDGETLKRMAACGARVFRTDLNGTVTIGLNEAGEMLIGNGD